MSVFYSEASYHTVLPTSNPQGQPFVQVALNFLREQRGWLTHTNMEEIIHTSLNTS